MSANKVTTGLDIGLLSTQCQASVWINAGLLLNAHF